MRLPFTASPTSISLFFKGRMFSVPGTDPAFGPLTEILKLDDHDYDAIESLIDKPSVVARLTEGAVTILGETVYYKGAPLRSTVAIKLIQMADAGFDARPWARFLERIMANPSERSRESLFDFLDKFNAPITEDGHFLAFKRVRKDYMDHYTGTFDNSPGNRVEMPREKVDDNSASTCSRGLHVAASSYLTNYESAENSRCIVCKVDPADVVAVPADYNFAKMRVSGYLVLGDAEESTLPAIEAQPVSYIGTEAATGAVWDEDGRAICYNATDFADNWKRTGTDVELGSHVVITDAPLGVVPANKFMTGTVVATEVKEEGWTEYLIEWQDGTDTLLVASNLAEVTYIGSYEEDEEEDDEEDDFDFDYEYQYEHSSDDFDEDDLEDEEGLIDPVPLHAFSGENENTDATANGEITFIRNGVTVTAAELLDGIKVMGQRGYSRSTGIPRTTLQDWLSRL
jgi:hypothetical protein